MRLSTLNVVGYNQNSVEQNISIYTIDTIHKYVCELSDLTNDSSFGHDLIAHDFVKHDNVTTNRILLIFNYIQIKFLRCAHTFE